MGRRAPLTNEEAGQREVNRSQSIHTARKIEEAEQERVRSV